MKAPAPAADSPALPPPGQDPEAAITLRGLGMRFGKAAPALDDINATVPKGTITGLVGPDAAGKTTLMRILAGLMVPTAGEALVLGQSPLDSAAQGHTGYMPQRFGLYEDLSVYDNLALHARLRGLEGQAREDIFVRLLEFTSLAPFTARLAGRLSGGMKQKLGIACALLGSPRVLLLDEPGVGVDPQSRRDLWRMVQDLSDGGMSIVWSTAYLEEAERCPHVIMLNEGRLLHEGPPEALTRKAAGRVFSVRSERGGQGPHDGPDAQDGAESQDSKSLLARWSGTEGVEDALIQGSHVRLVIEAEALPRLEPVLRADGAQPLPPRLEDAYMSALGGISRKPSPFARLAGATPAPGERIRAEKLTRRFGDFTAAEDISFSVSSGQIFGLLGPNGAGKSTTFRMLCGLLRPSSGQCHVDGVNLISAGSKARSRLGYMAQKFSLYTDIPVRDNIDVMADLYGLTPQQKKERIPPLVEALDLTPYLAATTGQLPLGQKQRLALLCATLHNPPVLFLDEPTSGVDARTRRDFWKHITAMTRAGTAVLVTTHFMEEAEYCDQIALVYQGKIISSGTPDQLKAQAPLGADAQGEPTLEDAFIAYIEAHNTRGTAQNEGEKTA